MKRTLALLIAVLMVMAMLPLSTFAAAGQANAGASAQDQATENESSGAQQTPPTPTDADYFAVYDANDAWVGYYATLAEADAALQDGYTLKILQSYTADAAYTWGASRAKKTAPIAYTVDGALAEGGNAVITAGAGVAAVWSFDELSVFDRVTLKNVTMVTEGAAIEAAEILLTLENCKLYAGNSYYEVDPAAYAEAPVANESVALNVVGGTLHILGEDTVLRATNGSALTVTGGAACIGNGYFYSSAAAKTVVMTAGFFTLTDATVVNNTQNALWLESTVAFIHGGVFAVTAAAEDATEAAAIYATQGGMAYLADGLAVAGANAYALATDEMAYFALFSMDRAAADEDHLQDGYVLATDYADAAITEGEAEITVIGEGTAEAPAHKIAVALQEQCTLKAPAENEETALRIYNAEGELVLYEYVNSNADMLEGMFAFYVMLVPDGGKLVLDVDLEVTEIPLTIVGFAGTDVTIEGGKEDISIKGNLTGYLMQILGDANVTLKNITVENTMAMGITVGSEPDTLDGMGATLTLGENASVIAKYGEAIRATVGTTVKLEDNAVVQSLTLPVGENAAVVVEGGAAFELNGEKAAVKAPAAQGITAFLSRATTCEVALGDKTYTYSFSRTSIQLNDGEVVLPAKAVTLHQVADDTVIADVTMTPAVDLRSALDASDDEGAFHFNNKEGAVELLDKDTHIAYYDSIAEALADVKDGYTVRLLADHVETGLIRTDFEEITWTLDGDGHRLYMPEINVYGMEFAGKNTKVEIKNLTLFSAGSGITVNPASLKSGVGVIANNVFVYAAGADDADPEAYVGDPAAATAFRVVNRGGELIIVGDKSGAYMNAQYAASTSLIHNRGYLAIYDGTYEAPVARLVMNQGAGGGTDKILQVTSYIAGGLFVVNGEDSVFLSNSATGSSIVVGGTAVIKNGNAFQISSGTVEVFGGDFYHLSDAAFSLHPTRTTYYGGNLYMKEANVETFLSGAKVMATRQLSDPEDYVTAEAEVALGIEAGTELVKISGVVNEIWLDENGLTHNDIAMKVYPGVGEDFIAVYNEKNLATALVAVGPYNGKIEIQKNIDIRHTAITNSRLMGPIANVTLTSAPGECFTYASSNYSGASTGSTYFLWLNGGNWRVENLTLANYGSQLIQVNTRDQSRVTVTVGEGGELSGHTSGVLMANTDSHLIVEEGGFINIAPFANTASANYGRLPANSNAVRLSGGSDLTVYGSIGYYRDGTLPDNGGYRCINYNSAAADVAGTGEQCTIYLASTAKLGTPEGTKTMPVINLSISDYSVTHDILVTAEPGATLTTDAYAVYASAGTQLKMDGVIIQNVVPAADGSFKGSDYAFVMNGAGGEFKNIEYYGTKFMSIDSKGMPKQDALTITFDGENKIVGKGASVLWNVAASCNTDLVINDGYYQSETSNFLYATADELEGAASEGKLTINNGTFYKDNGNNTSMFACLGSYDIVVEDGFFHLAYNALMFGMSATADKAPCSTELTINGGEFEIWYGWLYSDENAANETKLTINDCHVIAESGVDYAGTARTATGIMRIGGKCEAVINGGVFETEQFATNKTCDIIQSRHTASVTINDWTVYHRSGNESAIRVLGNSNITVNGGWIESNGRFVVRTMGGANTATAVKTPSEAILKVYGGTMILNPSHPKLSTSVSNCVIGNGGSEQFGHVYIYGGQFINRNDADRLTPDSGYSRQVLGSINPFGDFEIHGGIMIATAVQDYFFTVDPNPNGTGVAIPTVNLPIVKGVTPTYEMDGRDYYYVVYGMGDSLLVPELQTSFEADITEKGNGIVFTASMNAIHYNALITWARAHAYAYNKQFDANTEVMDNYTLKYGMMITTVDALRKTNGSIDVDKLNAVGAICLDKPADAADATVNADGTLDISATVENISVENNTVQYMAIPYVEIMLGVGTAQIITERHYGEYNSNAGVASMATVAATILRDNTDIATGAYQYPSLTVKNAFNRYTVEQQEILVTYLAHVHSFNYKGVCQDADCGEDIAVAIQESVAEQIYTESGSANFYKLTLKKDVTYTLGFTNDIVTYTLYTESGAVCALSAGMYTAAEDGTYYLRVQGKQVGSTQLIVSHIHNADFKGDCTVCEKNVSKPLVIEQPAEEMFVKKNVYFYSVELEANVDYSIDLINGTFRLYDAAGNEQTLNNNVFACVEAGTYYICVEATYTAKASICVAHVHVYNHMGVCMVQTCADNVCVSISGVYKYSPSQNVIVGDRMYFSVRMMAGRTYTLRTNHNLGPATLRDASGATMDLVYNTTFTCEADGVYYLCIDVAENVNSAQVRFEVSHGEDCSYNNKGECEFQHVNAAGELETVSCGKTSRTRVYDSEKLPVYMEAGQKYYFYFNYAGAGINYVIDLPVEGVEYILCDADGKQIVAGTDFEENITYTPGVNATDSTRRADSFVDEDSDNILYLVVTYTGTEAQTVMLSVTHVHHINHTGVCDVKDTTKSQNCSLTYRKTMEIDRTTTVEFVAGTTYYYELRLQAGVEYKMNFVNCPGVTWIVKNDAGELVHDSAKGNAFTCTTGGYYYLIITAAENSTGSVEAPATLTIQPHTHTLSNKGTCECGYAKEGFVIDLDQLLVDGGLKVGQLSAGKYYLHATMEAGKTYTLKFNISVGVAIAKLYGGENADVEQTLNDGAFTCTASGEYYYVVELSSITAAADSIAYSVDGSVAHVHTFSAAHHYVEKDGKYYRVIDKCDEETCSASWSEEITVLTADVATEIAYKVRDQRYYAVALEAGKTYTVSFVNSTANWAIVSADGTKLADKEMGSFLCEEDGVYYIEVLATSTSDDKHGAKATLTVVSE